MNKEVTDPIVDEVRKAGEAYLVQFNFDFEAACNDLRRRSAEAERPTIALKPRPPLTNAPVTKQVG